MRRALLARLPALTYVYGLRPWEVEHLTAAERTVYLDGLRDYLDAAAEGR